MCLSSIFFALYCSQFGKYRQNQAKTGKDRQSVQDRTRLASHYLAGCTIHNIYTVGTLDYQLSMSGAYCVLIDNRYSVRIQTLEQYKPCEPSVECNALV